MFLYSRISLMFFKSWTSCRSLYISLDLSFELLFSPYFLFCCYCVVLRFSIMTSRNEQSDFKRRTRSINEVSCIVDITERRKLSNLETWMCFLDLMNAYDMVPQDILLRKLVKNGYGDIFIGGIKSLHKRICEKRWCAMSAFWKQMRTKIKMSNKSNTIRNTHSRHSWLYSQSTNPNTRILFRRWYSHTYC